MAAKVDVAFKAQLVAVGEANSIDMHALEYDDTALMVFIAEPEDVRRAAALFRSTVSIYAGPLHDAAEDLLRALCRAEAVLRQRQGNEGLREEVRAAIEKAEGLR